MKTTFLISGVDMLYAIKSILTLGFKLLNFLKPKHLYRYIQLTPSVFRTQKLYDRKSQKILTLHIRDFVDFSTLSQVYFVEDYSIERLRRCEQLHNFYQSILNNGKIPLIIDCGGNIGLASRYFSENFPKAKIVCVEPDSKNIEQAKINATSPHISFLNAAVGSAQGRAVIVNPDKWSNAFRVKSTENGPLEMLTIPDILGLHSPDKYTPYLIKIDIEGYEAELFSCNTEWVKEFPLLVIELHDWFMKQTASSANFLLTVAPLKRDFVLQRDVVWSLSNDLSSN